MDYSIIIKDAREELGKLFVDTQNGTAIATDGVTAAMWRLKSKTIEAKIAIEPDRQKSVSETLAKLHYSDTVAAIKVDLKLLLKALRVFMVDQPPTVLLESAELRIKKGKAGAFVEIVRPSGETVLFMSLHDNGSFLSAMDILPNPTPAPGAPPTDPDTIYARPESEGGAAQPARNEDERPRGIRGIEARRLSRRVEG